MKTHENRDSSQQRAVAALALAGCAGGGARRGRRHDRHPRQPRPRSRRARRWRSSPRRARSRSAPSSTSRCSACRSRRRARSGFDVEIGKIIAAKLGIAEDEHRLDRDRLGQPRAVHRERTGRHRGRDVHDQRRPQGGRLLRRAVLRRRPGHPGARGQRGHHRARKTSRASRSARSTGSTPATNIVESTARDLMLDRRPTPTASSRCGTGRSSRVTTDNVILAGPRRPEPGRVRGRRRHRSPRSPTASA